MMRTSRLILVLAFLSLIVTTISLPTCHDTIPFSTKLNQSSLIVFGDIIKTSSPLSVNNITQTFNITFLVKCILKGHRPKNERIIIEHTLPDDPICYRTLVNGYTYVYFLHPTKKKNYYRQMPFHELLFNDDRTVEILRRTCGIQIRPFHKFIKKTENEIDERCPIVSIGCM